MDLVVADQLGDLLDNHPLNWKRRNPTVNEMFNIFTAHHMFFNGNRPKAIEIFIAVFALLYDREPDELLHMDYKYLVHFIREMNNEQFEL